MDNIQRDPEELLRTWIYFAVSSVVLLLSLIFVGNNILFIMLAMLSAITTAVSGIKLLFINNVSKFLLGPKYVSDISVAKKARNVNLEHFSGLFLRTGFVIAITTMILAFNWKASDKNRGKLGDATLPDDIEIEPPQTVQKPPPPPPPVVEIIEVEPDEVLEDPPDLPDSESDEDTKVDLPEPPPDEPSEPDFFIIVEDMPEFPGGEQKYLEFVQNNYRHPKIASENGIDGVIYFNFIVSPTGAITKVTILKGICEPCDKEALRVVRSMPKWKPGKQRGKPVKVQASGRIRVTLN